MTITIHDNRPTTVNDAYTNLALELLVVPDPGADPAPIPGVLDNDFDDINEAGNPGSVVDWQLVVDTEDPTSAVVFTPALTAEQLLSWNFDALNPTAAGGNLRFLGPGSFHFLSPIGYAGTVTFQYKAIDDDAQASFTTGTVTITVASGSPTSGTDLFQSVEDAPLVINLADPVPTLIQQGTPTYATAADNPNELIATASYYYYWDLNQAGATLPTDGTHKWYERAYNPAAHPGTNVPLQGIDVPRGGWSPTPSQGSFGRGPSFTGAIQAAFHTPTPPVEQSAPGAGDAYSGFTELYRTTFDVTGDVAPGDIEYIHIDVLFDDGVVLYLNDRPIYANNMDFTIDEIYQAFLDGQQLVPDLYLVSVNWGDVSCGVRE